MPPFTIPRVILRDAARAEWLSFENPLEIVTVSQLDEVLPALRRIEALVEANGWHAAGFISYEAAPAFDQACKTRPAADFPYLWFGLYAEPRRSAAPLTPPILGVQNGGTQREADAGFTLAAWTPSVTRAAYDAAIAQVKQQIERGATYQVNYTFRLRSQLTGSPWSLFVAMLQTQPVEYAAFIDTGRHVICCASPELFFRLEGQKVTCRPMKGTAPRGRTLAEDQAAAAALLASPKERAENVMIVDMLRNDLGRIARLGSVQVPALFSAERYRTLWQMTSTVTAQVDAPFADLMTALFPCASITGAPKISTMSIIAALENAPRKLYTGAMGFLAPGRQAQFNVAIRTALIDRETGEAEYGVGSGVVWDSTAGNEYAESLLKARALPRWRRASGTARGRHDAARLTEPQAAFALLETLRWTPAEGWFLREAHLKRLRDSAAYFGFVCDGPAIERLLTEMAPKFNSAKRVRLLLHADGRLQHEVFDLPPQIEARRLRVRLAAAPVDDQDVFLFHKTTRRAVYENARAAQPGLRRERSDERCDDVLLYNTRGELTEATIANLVVELNSDPATGFRQAQPTSSGRGLFTPPVSCGLLAGTFRATLLEQGIITERLLRREDLARCTQLFLVNSVRGWMQAELTSPLNKGQNL